MQMPVTVQAVLCWSEYYNGKWQPTKTSDVDHPTGLGQYPPTGPKVFDRAQLLLGVYEEGDALEEDALLRVSIFCGSVDSVLSSFLLYNTHSLPVCREDAPATLKPEQPGWRVLRREKDMFTIYYGPSVYDRSGVATFNVLQDPIPFMTIEPLHPLQNAWDAPFFFQDSRHVFYVSTCESFINAVNPPPQPGPDIPPLVFKQDPRLETIPVKYGPVITGPHPGIVDPSPLERFVSEDANIRTTISTGPVVRFGDREIGPAGELANRQMSLE
jgi:hypothetical protein